MELKLFDGQISNADQKQVMVLFSQQIERKEKRKMFNFLIHTRT